MDIVVPEWMNQVPRLDRVAFLAYTIRICHYAVERSTMTQYKVSYQLYGINFLSLAVCDGEEYAVNDKKFFLPGRLVTFKWE